MNIENIAALARLSLDEKEKQKIQGDIEGFAEFASLLDNYSAKIGECVPAANPSFREDIPCDGGKIADGYICVPLTVEVSE